MIALGASSVSAGAKAKKVLVSELSDEIVVVDGKTLVPVDDLAAAAGCKLRRNAESRAYEAWPCKPGALLQLDVDALATHSVRLTPAEEGENKYAGARPEHQLRFGEHIASRTLVLHEGRAYLTLPDVVVLMGGKLERKGKKARIVVPGGAEAPLAITAG
ncbi:MAG: hypothetical protein IAG13_18985 [Deltaproteobacteria bacterium]|nr:hypothetical protein [Nannocystaceae bacterium]